MDISLLDIRKKSSFLSIIFLLTFLISFNFTKCIIEIGNNKYTSGNICTNNKNILSIEYSNESSGDKRLFYSLQENGRGNFENDEDIKEITISSDKYYQGKNIIERYESINAFVSLESDKEKKSNIY